MRAREPDSLGGSERSPQRRWPPALLLAFLAGVGAGCPRAFPVPRQQVPLEFTVPAPRDQVFEALLRTAPTLGLSPVLAERGNGFARFENALLTPEQLDRYCRYVFNNQAGQPFDTFVNWSTRSVSFGAGPVHGSVALTALLTDGPAGTATVKLLADWWAANNTETHIPNSKLVLESELRDLLSSAVAGAPHPTATPVGVKRPAEPGRAPVRQTDKPGSWDKQLNLRIRSDNDVVILRETPDPSGRVVERLSSGTEVAGLGWESGWFKVRSPAGAIGYVEAKFLERAQ